MKQHFNPRKEYMLPTASRIPPNLLTRGVQSVQCTIHDQTNMEVPALRASLSRDTNVCVWTINTVDIWTLAKLTKSHMDIGKIDQITLKNKVDQITLKNKEQKEIWYFNLDANLAASVYFFEWQRFLCWRLTFRCIHLAPRWWRSIGHWQGTSNLCRSRRASVAAVQQFSGSLRWNTIGLWCLSASCTAKVRTYSWACCSALWDAFPEW